MKHFLLKLRPLELYTFGTEQGSSYNDPSVKKTGKESYIIASNAEPDQTTIFGTVRYMILKKKGLLKTDFSYDAGDQQALQDAIGAESFKFMAEDQSFGLLKKISPMFLADEENRIYIRNPFCNAGTGDYKPMKMSAGTVSCSKGDLHLPLFEDGGYKAKDGYGRGYISLEKQPEKDSEDKKHEVIAPENIFTSYLLTGNQTLNGVTEEGFFKREAYSLKSRFCFAVYVTVVDDLFADGDACIVHMGTKNNAFSAVLTEVTEEESDLAKRVEEAFSEGDALWYYCLSDLYLPEGYQAEDFCIVEEKHVRNIETLLMEKGGYLKKRKKNARINLVKAGSSFYIKAPRFAESKNCEAAGYNCIVKLGGR